MSTTMKDLFDDDSSSEEEGPPPKGDVPPPHPPKAVASPAGMTRRIIQEDDSSDDEPSTKPQVEKQTTEKKESVLEAESNEKTLEKEESGAVMEKSSDAETPASSSQAAETNDANKKMIAEEEDDDDEDVEFDDDGVVGSSAPPPTETPAESTEETSTTKRPAKKPRHIQVLESSRPPAGTSLHITKLPNLVGIQTEPFDADTYSASIEEQEYRGYLPSMIRWRYARDDNGEFKRNDKGNLIRESNTRLVAWNDGNGGPTYYTLHVGDEVFEVDANDSSSNGFAGLNGYLYLSQKATLPDEDHTPAGTVLESMGAIQSRLVARPSSLQSEAHKKLTVAVRQKTIKKARIAEYVTQEDPEKAKQERIKVKQDLEKASARKRQSYGQRRPAMNRRYLEEDDGNYDSVNIRDMKRRARDFDEDMDYGEDSEEEEEDDFVFNRRRQKRVSKQQQEEEELDDDEEDELVFEEDSDEEVVKTTSRKKLQHQALVDEDDDE